MGLIGMVVSELSVHVQPCNHTQNMKTLLNAEYTIWTAGYVIAKGEHGYWWTRTVFTHASKPDSYAMQKQDIPSTIAQPNYSWFHTGPDQVIVFVADCPRCVRELHHSRELILGSLNP